jgi:hypothetical protein
MRIRKKLPFQACSVLFLCFAFSALAFGTTWDEPWHKDVVAKADTFGLYEAVSSTGRHAIFKKVQTFAGAATEESVEVDGFYGLSLTTTSTFSPGIDDDWAGTFRNGSRYYLFLKKAPAGNTWKIATPSTGFASIQTNGKVLATYRISLHQATVDPKIYELTQTCIFLRLHGSDKCSAEAYKYIDDQVSVVPPTMSGNVPPDQVDRFFTQHAALETAYLAGYPLPLETLSKFLANAYIHIQISGVRALSASNLKDRNQLLMTFVMDQTKNSVARVIAVRMIREVNARDLKDQMMTYLPNASNEETGLGMNIMDPRVGTVFPSSVKEALTQLIADWK